MTRPTGRNIRRRLLALPLLLIPLLASVSPSFANDSSSVSKAPTKTNASEYAPLNPDANTLKFIGRFDFSTQGKAQFTWPNSALEFQFVGTQASIKITSEKTLRFLVNVDGQSRDLFTTSGEAVYPLVSRLPNGKHTVRITRVSESFTGVSAFTSMPYVDGKLLSAPNNTHRKLLVIGDSITAGYGVEGENEHCDYAIETSNSQLTYAALTANTLHADLHTLAWSGIGVWRSYGEVTPKNPTITVRQKRILADDAHSVWNPAHFQPNAILINIGTNDYWEGSSREYKAHMQKLIKTLREDYPNQPMYLIVSPMLSGDARASQHKHLISLQTENIQVLDLGRIEQGDGLGCHYHPNIITQQKLAKKLTTQLQLDLDW